MTTLERNFFDAYKRLDAKCAAMLHDNNGVKAYLNHMDTVPSAARRGIGSWSYDRSTLIRLRHVRNQIAHDAESSSCTEEDLNKLEKFYSRLLQGEDALSKYIRLNTTRQPKQHKQPKQEKPQVQIKGKRKSRKLIHMTLLTIFLVSLILFSYIAFLLFYHL